MPISVVLTYAVPATVWATTFYLQITWTDPTDPNSASVNIYRSTVSGGPYTKIANIALGVQTYNDYLVSPGVDYFYVLTEVNNVGAESGYSTEQSGIPGSIP